MSTISALQSIGLTDGEIKVYEALLDLGESTKTKLTKVSGVSPANLYDITDRLSKKGLISIVKKDGVKHFVAANPRNLLDYLDHKRQNINSEQQRVMQILPTLKAKYEAAEEGTKVEVFTGWSGMKTVFLDLIDECAKEEDCFVYGASKGQDEAKADHFFLRYSKLRAGKGIRTRIIFNEEMRKRRKRISFFIRNPKCEVRFLHQETNAEVMVYRDVVVFLILTAAPLVIRVREKGVAQSFKSHFELLWETAHK